MRRCTWAIGMMLLVGWMLSGCGNSGQAVSEQGVSGNAIVASKTISTEGGTITVTDQKSLIYGVTIIIPPGALGQPTVVTLKQVDGPPALPMGFNFVGTPTDFEPDGTTFATPVTIEMPFTQADLDRAGVLDGGTLQVYAFDTATQIWSQVENVSLDLAAGKVIVQARHFSFYTVAGFSGNKPTSSGKPLPGDLLYKLTSVNNGRTSGWTPGHVGMYVGDTAWDGKGLASDEVKRCRRYNVVEALWGGVQFSYYKIPNTVQLCKTEELFEGNSVYMGAREPKAFSLNGLQRKQVIEYVKEQVGKPYAKGQTYGALFDLLTGQFVKGPNSFNCVGLIEKAYEVANTNVIVDYAHGIVPYDEADTLTPSGQYSRTKPATGTSSSGGSTGWTEVNP